MEAATEKLIGYGGVGILALFAIAVAFILWRVVEKRLQRADHELDAKDLIIKAKDGELANERGARIGDSKEDLKVLLGINERVTTALAANTEAARDQTKALEDLTSELRQRPVRRL